MEPIEVRIGNYVLVPQTNSRVLIPSVPKKIKGITSQEEFEVAEGHFDIMIKVPAKHCKGIQLRTSHLEFLGFKKMNDIQFIHKVLDVTLDDCNEFFMWSLHKNLNIRIDYVHQLQNLFADLTVNNYIPDFNSYFKKHTEGAPLQVV